MNDYPAQIVVKVLYQEFPELAAKVNAKIKERIPDCTLTKLAHIDDIVQVFCVHEHIDAVMIRNQGKSKTYSQKRRVLFALILKLYQPGVLCKLVDGPINSAIGKKLQQLLGVSKKTVSYDMGIAKSNYHIYRDFRANVDSLYNKIIESHGKDQ